MRGRAGEHRRITILGPAFPYRGGIAHFVEQLAETLVSRGNAVSLVTFTRQYPDFLFPGESQLSDEGVGDRLSAARVVDSMNPLTWRRAARRIVASGSDAVVIKYWIPFLAPCLGWICRAARKRGITTIAVIDNAIPHERRPFDRPLSRFLIRSCDTLLVMSDEVGADVRELVPGAHVRRVEHPTYSNFGPPVGMRAAREAIGVEPDATMLLFFGLVRAYKGLDLLIESMASLRSRYSALRLVAAGDFYDDPEKYRSLVQRLGLSDVVDLRPGYVPDELVTAYFSAADLVVLPYKAATQSGIAQIAMHFERPLLVTDCGGLAEMVGRGRSGIVVEPGSVAALEEGIASFLDDPGAADRLSGGAREMKGAYSWEALAEIVESEVDKHGSMV